MATDASNGKGSISQHYNISEQIASFRAADDAREKLIQGLLNELFLANQDKQRFEDDFHNEAQSRRNWQTQANESRREIDSIRRRTETDTFAVALIDGDGCVFQDALLRQAGDGGAEAAHLLYTAIQNTMNERNTSVGTIMVNIYADLDSLSRKLASVGLISTAADLQTFTRAFSMSKPLFNFIDVGKGKERADHKLREMFRLFVHNVQCRHVVFAGCHDNGYLPDLMPYKHDASVASRLTLLETTNAEYQYRDLGFDIARYVEVFRSKQLPDSRYMPSTYQQNIQSPKSGASLSGAATAFSPLPQAQENTYPIRAPPGLATGLNSPGFTAGLNSPGLNGHTSRADGLSQRETSTDSNSPSAPSPALSWATVGGAAQSKNISIAPAEKPKARKYCLYNADSQRIDEELPRINKEAEANVRTRLAKHGKLCNNHHLRRSCPKGSTCGYSHEPPLRDAEKNVLRHRARTTPCSKYR